MVEFEKCLLSCFSLNVFLDTKAPIEVLDGNQASSYRSSNYPVSRLWVSLKYWLQF